jgi:hypothetical protein
MMLTVAILAAVAQSVPIDGTICRINRNVDRMIVATDAGPRLRVVLGRSTVVHFESHDYERGDLRPGDRVHLLTTRKAPGVTVSSIDVTMRAGDALLDSLLRSHRTIVGRFAVREAKTEFFSLNLPGDAFLRVDAKAAIGPNGRVHVSSLKPGDLLEIKGTWPSKDLLQATSINIITDYEPSFCRTTARRGEMRLDTEAREASEVQFLAHQEK